MKPIQFVVEDHMKQSLERFAKAAVKFLTDNIQYDEFVRLANSITELEHDTKTKPDNIHALPEGFHYRFSGFYGQVIGVARGKR